ncbi:alpha/beta hydrolase [Oceanirhabdus sp. W0125-5]|uniref:alpha/beta hydrolase n=1 Tax=Oceanirhabdus sp. W0125-5 TaxID=2999116 RepID=UPI0022F2FE97|nr:alpha/beta hydrolase [Oceanirhabdus sp. W0125-5]WBW96700.1 alpha/beta hydrolase [Oceanirhabdus sp. W0125-5]
MKRNFIEEQVTIKGEVILKGTLAIPQMDKEKLPAVLIVNGSGPADRDGNINRPGMSFNIYKKIAHFISELGFITLRYDKRGSGESEGEFNSTGMSDLINDINNNIKFLQNHLKVDKDKIILLGHSEGCILSTLANEITPVSGVILLSGAGKNLKHFLHYQNISIINEAKTLKGLKGVLLKANFKERKILKNEEKYFNKLENSTGDTIRMNLGKVPAKWYREHFKYSSEEILDKLNNAQCPIIAITGVKDVQANPVDLESIEKLGNDDIKCMVIDNMDHMLREYKGEKTIFDMMKQYKKGASQPIHPQLKAVLGEWLARFN